MSNELDNYEELLSLSEIDPFMKLDQNPTILEFGNKLFGTRGNFSCLVGKPKSRKTFLLSLLEAICLKEEIADGLIKSFIENTTILHFDLEQSDYHVHKYSNRVYELIEKTNKISNYKVFALREHNPTTRLIIIERALAKYKNISLLVIDGIADLVTSYNDEEQANNIVNKLMKWSKNMNIHILTVIHEPKSQAGPKGHLGSFVLQKAETVLSVKTDIKNSITTVSSQASRNPEIPNFEFLINKHGLPRLK